jgi:hypothetical protein
MKVLYDEAIVAVIVTYHAPQVITMWVDPRAEDS